MGFFFKKEGKMKNENEENSLPSFPLHLTLAVITLLVSNQRGPEADNNNTTFSTPYYGAPP
jgi:hypothetical protein